MMKCCCARSFQDIWKGGHEEGEERKRGEEEEQQKGSEVRLNSDIKGI